MSTLLCTPLEQHGVYAEPGGEGERALHLVAMFAHLGHGRVAADHRHDALVLVGEGLGAFSPQLSDDVLCGPPSRLLGHRAELGECSPVVTRRNVRHVSHGVGTGVAGQGEVWSDVKATTAPWRGAGVLGDGRRRLASCPDHSPRRDGAAIIELDTVGVYGGDPRSQPDLCARLGELLERVRVGLVGELPQQGVAAVDERYPARLRQPSRLMKRNHELGQSSGGLNAGRPTPHHDDVDRTGLA